MLDDAKTPNGPQWWLLRLGTQLARESRRFDKLESYWRGDPPMPHGNRKMREAYRRLQHMARTNFGALIVESLLERMKVVAFRDGSGGSDTSDRDAWLWWQANSLDADQGLVHRAAVMMSRAYVIVGRDKTGAPLITGEDPRQVIHESSPTNRRELLAALKTWWDDVASCQRAVLYLPDTVHYFVTVKTITRQSTSEQVWGQAAWEIDTTDPDFPDGVGTNPLGEVAVTPFINRPDLAGNGLGEFEDVLDILDRINTVILDRLVVSAMQAYRQRWAKGVSTTDESGNPQTLFDPGADLLWAVEDDNAQFGEFHPTDVTPIVKATEADVQYLSAITRTPPHYLLGAIVNAPLALDTVVPVPGGRTTMGELTVGDEVFDEHGNVQHVVGVSPVFHDRDCFRLTFSDGTTVVADGEHRWMTTHQCDMGWETSLMTTDKIAATLADHHEVETAYGTTLTITAVEPVDSVPVRCITVDSDSHLFCITDGFVQTSNSGDALGIAESGLVSKLLEREGEFGESWERVYRQVGVLQGKTVSQDAEVVWKDPQFRTLTEMASAALQLMHAGVPWRTRMRFLDMSPQEIDRMEAERAHDALLSAQLASLAVAEGGEVGTRGVAWSGIAPPTDANATRTVPSGAKASQTGAATPAPQ